VNFCVGSFQNGNKICKALNSFHGMSSLGIFSFSNYCMGHGPCWPISGESCMRGATHAPLIPLSSSLFIKQIDFNENGGMKGDEEMFFSISHLVYTNF
jgi:hypothetical protein